MLLDSNTGVRSLGRLLPDIRVACTSRHVPGTRHARTHSRLGAEESVGGHRRRAGRMQVVCGPNQRSQARWQAKCVGEAGASASRTIAVVNDVESAPRKKRDARRSAGGWGWAGRLASGPQAAVLPLFRPNRRRLATRYHDVDAARLIGSTNFTASIRVPHREAVSGQRNTSTGREPQRSFVRWPD